MPKGYVIITEDIHDPELMRSYAAASVPPLIAHGGTLLVADEDVTVVEGAWNGTRTVVVEFASVEAAHAWYRSPEYQSAVQLRHAASNCNLATVAGYTPRGPLA